MKIISISCPICGCSRLIDTSKKVISEVFPLDKSPNDWIPDYIQKCHKCGNKIGIKKIS